MIQDFNSLADGAELTADICIIGAGVAGLTLAHEFIEGSLKVLVLEGGGEQLEPESQALYQATMAGVPHRGTFEGRFRVLGGTSTKWGSQLLPLTASDFTIRPHVHGSGWPFDLATLQPYYERAAHVLEVNTLSYDQALCAELELRPEALDPASFKMRFAKWAKFGKRNLAGTVGRRCARSGNVDIILHANAVEIMLDRDSGRVTGIAVRSLAGRRGIVRAKAYVVACGTLESARLLLASNSVVQEGVGNTSGLVGRYFQDHLSIRAGELWPHDPRRLMTTFSSIFHKGTMHSVRLELQDAVQREMGCMSAFGQVVFESSENSGFAQIRDMLRAAQARQNPFPGLRGIWYMLRDTPYMLRLAKSNYLGGRLPYPPRARFFLDVDIEQEPAENSRVTLSPERDALGIPRLRVDWQLAGKERFTAAVFVERFRHAWELAGFGTAQWNERIFKESDAWLADVVDTYHQAGTTRMSTNPRFGVVDPDLCLHDVTNLYIASCSVFPVSGSANPTFTLMALCMRLADHLKASFKSNAG